MSRLYVLMAVALLNVASAFAQHENAQKLLGCWTLDKLEFTATVEGSQQVIDEAKGTKICFENNGKFNNGKTGRADFQTGTYSVSTDGKTIEQKVDRQDGFSVDLPGTIILLDDKNLNITADGVVLYFLRAN